jgi:LacI family transcriptional regulator
MPDDQLTRVLEFGKPVVFSGRPAPKGHASIGVDARSAAYMLGELLVKQGHRRIAYAGFAPARPDMERMRGLTESLASHGLAATRYELQGPTILEGERICSSIVLGRDKPDAVVCYNDMVAIGFMGAARSMGVSIPEDLSVVGIDNIPYGRFTHPPLTTVDTRSEHLGEEGMRMLFREIEGAGPSPAGHVRIEPRLVVRESTRPRTVPAKPASRASAATRRR